MFTEGFEKTAATRASGILKSWKKLKRKFGTGVPKKKLALTILGAGAVGAGAYALREHARKTKAAYENKHGKGSSDSFDPENPRDVKRLLKIQGIR